MAVHEVKGPELALSDCDHGCKIYGCKCGERHVWHNAIYGCPIGKRIEAAWIQHRQR